MKNSRIKKLLEAIKSETQPIEEHSDANAIQDCWAEVFSLLSEDEDENVTQALSDAKQHTISLDMKSFKELSVEEQWKDILQAPSDLDLMMNAKVLEEQSFQTQWTDILRKNIDAQINITKEEDLETGYDGYCVYTRYGWITSFYDTDKGVLAECEDSIHEANVMKMDDACAIAANDVEFSRVVKVRVSESNLVFIIKELNFIKSK